MIWRIVLTLAHWIVWISSMKIYISGKQISCIDMIGNAKCKAFPVHSFSLTWSYCGSTMASGFGTDTMRSNSVCRHSTGVQVICPVKTVSSHFCTHFVLMVEKKEGMAMHVETAMQWCASIYFGHGYTFCMCKVKLNLSFLSQQSSLAQQQLLPFQLWGTMYALQAVQLFWGTVNLFWSSKDSSYLQRLPPISRQGNALKWHAVF